MSLNFVSSLALAVVALVGGWVKCLKESNDSTPWYRRITTGGKVIAISILGLTALTLYLNARDQAHQSRQLLAIRGMAEVGPALDGLSQDMKKIDDDATQIRSYTTKDIDRKEGGLVKIDFNKHLKNLENLFSYLENAQNLIKNAPKKCLNILERHIKMSDDQKTKLLEVLRNVHGPPSVTNSSIIRREMNELRGLANKHPEPDAKETEVLKILTRMQIVNDDLSFSMFSAVKHYERIISAARRTGHDYLVRTLELNDEK